VALLHALKNRLFQGFLTTGQLGVAALRSAGVPRSLIATGLYPVDCTWWRQQCRRYERESRALRNALGGSVVVVAVSKMSDREDPLTAIRGFAKMAATIDGARLLFVGDGPLRSHVENEIRTLGIGTKVRLEGYVRYESLAACYRAADVFIHVPRREPWGISVGEAMACGLPVVASSTVGSAADLVMAGRTGFIVPPSDPAEVSAALLAAVDLLAEPCARRAISAAAQSVDVTTAANEIELLVDRFAVLPTFDPIRQVVISELKNHWGKWPA
jgi:glycosyltransferase involved in cell wall biosynthesis